MLLTTKPRSTLARVTSVDPNATVSFFFTADPQFGWGASYSGNEERALRTMIDLGRITVKCTDCPQIIPIAGDLTMNGENRHIYRLGYKGAQSFGVKVLDGIGNHDTHSFADDEVSFDNTLTLRMGQSLREKGWVVVDTWTTVFSEDNDCGFYCQHADAHYYTIGITNRLLNPTTIMAYVVQLHNGIYSDSAVQYLERIRRTVIDTSKPIILVAHQFTGNAIMQFNETIRQLNVALIINGHYHCDQVYDLNHCDFRDNSPVLLIDRFGADFLNVHGAVIPRVTCNAAFHNIFWSVTLHGADGAIYLKRYDNFHVARSGVTLYGEAASTNAQNYFRFPLEQFSSPNVTPMWPRNYVYLRRLEMWPSTFNQLVTLQFNMHGFNLPYRDARALKCLYTQPHQRCVDNYRLRHL